VSRPIKLITQEGCPLVGLMIVFTNRKNVRV